MIIQVKGIKERTNERSIEAYFLQTEQYVRLGGTGSVFERPQIRIMVRRLSHYDRFSWLYQSAQSVRIIFFPNKQTPWPESASELYRSSDRRLSSKLVLPFADRRCRVVSAIDPRGRIIGFLDRSRYYFFKVARQLYSRGWVDFVPDPLPLRKSGSAGTHLHTPTVFRLTMTNF
jgi:hypothetical protein